MISKLFENGKYNLPILNYEEDLQNFLDRFFREYLQDIKKINIKYKMLSTKELDLIEMLIKGINQAFDSLYNGFPHQSYLNIRKAFKEIMDYLIYFDFTNYEESILFRARSGSNVALSQKEMFHIPFEMRNIVKSFRYSIPGYPSLYLGNSSYVCWNELRRPNLDSIQMCGLRISKNVKEKKKKENNSNNHKEVSNTKLNVLDFGYRPQDIVYYYNLSNQPNWESYNSDDNYSQDNFKNILLENKNYFKNYIILWPLIASCSVKVRDDMSAFKSEYIIPQLLLQWIRAERLFDGIRYFSITYDFSSQGVNLLNPVELIHNYVFPTKEISNQGYCRHLSSMFEISNSVILGLNDTIAVNQRNNYLRHNYNSIAIEIHKDYFANYKDTKFYEVEKVINAIPFSNI